MALTNEAMTKGQYAARPELRCSRAGHPKRGWLGGNGLPERTLCNASCRSGSRTSTLFLTLWFLATVQACADRHIEPTPTWLAAESLVRVSAGGEHSCALLDDGTVACWGEGACGLLGDGTARSHEEPVRVRGLSDAVDVSAGALHACALLTDGSVECWGVSVRGRLGSPARGTRCESPQGKVLEASFAPVAVANLPPASVVRAGWHHSCAVVRDGEVYCWGNGGSGQLGDGTTAHEDCEGEDCAREPVQVLGLQGVADVAVGYRHSCALLVDGTVQCWGAGRAITSPYTPDAACPSVDPGCSSVPVPVPGIDGAVSVSAGQFHTCALLEDGAVSCWGDNQYGQLGDVHEENGHLVTAPVVSGAQQIDAGSFHTCAVDLKGKVRCWGLNWAGQLGDGTTEPRGKPVLLQESEEVLVVDAGHLHSCALLAGGTASCWGVADNNRLGAEGYSSCDSEGVALSCSLNPVRVR